MITFKDYRLVSLRMFNRASFSLIIQGLWVIGLVALFCDFAPVQKPAEPDNSVIQITAYCPTSDLVYINPPNENNNLCLNAGIRSKKAASSVKDSSYSARQYLISGWKKDLKTIAHTTFVFDCRIQPAFLLLDKPPPSDPV